jgi:hypothetical protein
VPIFPRKSVANVTQLAEELKDLVVDYVKQETVEPAKQLGWNFGYSLLAGILLGNGFVLLMLAVVRAAQTELVARVAPEAGIGSYWSLLPYGIAFVVGLVVVVVAFTLVQRSRTAALRSSSGGAHRTRAAHDGRSRHGRR